MPSVAKKEQRVEKLRREQERLAKQKERKETTALLQQVTQHNAIKITDKANEIFMAIKINFKKSAALSLVGKDDGPKKDQSK
jgi:hypothetical protein